MTLNLELPEREELKPKLTVFGIGGAGGNAVNNMIDKELDGVDFVVANTDAQALQQSNAGIRIQMGVKVTEGLGAGARPEVGAAAAEETIEEIVENLTGSHMCFITAGMGGGTGTGAAPIIAQAARDLGVLTVGVVTKPFLFEGAKRMRQAEEGVDKLQGMVDTLIIIPNQNLFRLANEKTTFTEAFSIADDVLYQGVKGVTDLMVRPGLINLDFADVRAAMDEMGKAMMGTGEAAGEDRATQAAEKAIANPLLDEISLRGAKGVLINITGGKDLTLFEVDEAASRVREEVDDDANIIVGSTLDPKIDGTVRVSVVATGIDVSGQGGAIEAPRRRSADHLKVVGIAGNGLSGAGSPEAAAKAEPQAHSAAESGSDSDEPPLFAAVDTRKASKGGQAAGEDAGSGGGGVPESELEAAAFESRSDGLGDDSAESFVAPKPGAPRPEAIARLQAAVEKAPRPQPARIKNAKPGSAGGKSRFGINSLIGRMTNSQKNAPERSDEAEEQSSGQSEDAESRQDPDADQERIEVPAFLRRQAN